MDVIKHNESEVEQLKVGQNKVGRDALFTVLQAFTEGMG